MLRLAVLQKICFFDQVMRQYRKKKNLILECNLSLGDIVLLTAAVRDLHLSYPGLFITDVRTPYPEIWEHNPYIKPLDEKDKNVQRIQCSYPLIHQSNTTSHHAIHGFIHFLNKHLTLNITSSAFKGDIHLSPDEKGWLSQVAEMMQEEIPFWLIAAGGKQDVTIKWWDKRRYQKVIDAYRGKIQFVQIGANNHYHPKLEGVIDLRGNTSVRQLIRLVYHSQGVLCPVTSLMHLAAAIEVKPGRPKNRACVVIAGGRESSQWEAYPHHQFIHTNGALLCCDNGGCWKSRVFPLGDGDERDAPQHLCVDVVGKFPRCMKMISAIDVIRRIRTYFEGGALRYLNTREQRVSGHRIREGEFYKWDKSTLEKRAFKRASEKFVRKIPEYPNSFSGSGIVICAGGIRYLTCGWVCINMLRRLGSSLPIEIWHLGEEELPTELCALISRRGATFVDASKLRETKPARILQGWPLKAYAILNSRFENVLLLDADNVPIKNPEYLFKSRQFKKTGAIFWPDFGRMSRNNPIWNICGVKYKDEPEFESGQILVNKRKCWKALSLALWYNEHADFYYQHILGDKDTFHLAFRKLKQAYSMPSTPIWPLDGVMCQHDFKGKRIFQHRNLRKWVLNGDNPKTVGFLYERECIRYLDQLRKQLNGRSSKPRPLKG